MKPGCHKTGNVRHIHHQNGSHFVDFPEFLKINGSRISGSSCDNHSGPAFQRSFPEPVIINEAFVIYAVRHDFEILAGDVYRASVGQMTTMVKIHSHDGVAGITYRKLHRKICLCA